jgi:hypothetical protein
VLLDILRDIQREREAKGAVILGSVQTTHSPNTESECFDEAIQHSLLAEFMCMPQLVKELYQMKAKINFVCDMRQQEIKLPIDSRYYVATRD